MFFFFFLFLVKKREGGTHIISECVWNQFRDVSKAPWIELREKRTITFQCWGIKCCASLVSLVRAGVSVSCQLGLSLSLVTSLSLTPTCPSSLFVNLNICHYPARLPTCPFLLPLPRPVINILHMNISTHVHTPRDTWKVANQQHMCVGCAKAKRRLFN